MDDDVSSDKYSGCSMMREPIRELFVADPSSDRWSNADLRTWEMPDSNELMARVFDRVRSLDQQVVSVDELD